MPTMMKICTSSEPRKRDAEEIAAEHIGEVEQDRENEGDSERAFDPRRQTLEKSRNHRRIAPVSHAGNQRRRGLLFITRPRDNAI